jgi:hypothetical protein
MRGYYHEKGTDVVHEFVIENRGDLPLYIEKLKTSCGCTTADIIDSYSNNLENKIEFMLQRKAERYLLTVDNLTENPGEYRGIIHLKTDSPIEPEIIIYVFGVITQKKS